jgi:hypothetical protein
MIYAILHKSKAWVLCHQNPKETVRIGALIASAVAAAKEDFHQTIKAHAAAHGKDLFLNSHGSGREQKSTRRVAIAPQREPEGGMSLDKWQVRRRHLAPL